jgi:hypothetical protein
MPANARRHHYGSPRAPSWSGAAALLAHCRSVKGGVYSPRGQLIVNVSQPGAHRLDVSSRPGRGPGRVRQSSSRSRARRTWRTRLVASSIGAAEARRTTDGPSRGSAGPCRPFRGAALLSLQVPRGWWPSPPVRVVALVPTSIGGSACPVRSEEPTMSGRLSRGLLIKSRMESSWTTSRQLLDNCAPSYRLEWVRAGRCRTLKVHRIVVKVLCVAKQLLRHTTYTGHFYSI